VTLVIRGFEPHQAPMPFKTHEQMRRYQATWMWRRRLQWIVDNGPCSDCYGTRDLRVVYKDPADKTVRVPSIWSLSQERRTELLAKCVVLCETCAKLKRREELSASTRGEI
jgi:hypothetical protein